MEPKAVIADIGFLAGDLIISVLYVHTDSVISLLDIGGESSEICRSSSNAASLSVLSEITKKSDRIIDQHFKISLCSISMYLTYLHHR